MVYSLIDYGLNGKEDKYLGFNKIKVKWVEDTTKHGLDREWMFLTYTCKSSKCPMYALYELKRLFCIVLAEAENEGYNTKLIPN